MLYLALLSLGLIKPMPIELSPDPLQPSPALGASPPPTHAQRAAGAVRLVSRHSFALADQVLISGSNFAVMLVCTRAMSKELFGAFAMVHTGVLLLASLQSALITQPHAVLASARLDPREYRGFTGTLLALQLLLTVAVAALTLGATGIGSALNIIGGPFVYTTLAALLLALTWQFQEFARRVLYTERRHAVALINDVICYGVQPLLLFALWRRGLLADNATAPAIALAAMAAPYALASIHGMWVVRKSIRFCIDRAQVRETWRFGQWLAYAEVVNWFSSFAMYQYAAGILIGPAAAAALKAAQVIFGPARIISFFLCNVLPVQFSRTLAQRGQAAMNSQLKRVMLALAPTSASYCLAIAIFAGPLLRLLYGSDKYESDWLVLALFAFASWMGNLLMAMMAALTARQLTRELFWSYVAAGVVAVPLAVIGIQLWQVSGAVAALITADFLLAILFWQLYRRSMRTPQPQ